MSTTTMDAQDQTQSQAPAPTQEAAPPQVAPQVQEAAPPSPDLVALQAKLAQYEAQLQEKESAWSQERELLRSGVLDAEAQEVAQHFYAKIPAPKEGTKPTISQWLANRDALPKAVAAYLPQAQAPQVQQVHTPQAGAAPQAAPAPVRLPDSDRGAGAAPQASSSFSPTAIKSLTPQEYAASRAAILASLGKR